MVPLLHHGLLLLTLSSVCRRTSSVPMEKLASSKLCADKDCSYTISVARAISDFTAPDCRFINIKSGQMIYVYSKLVPEEGGGVFWSGSVYSDRYVDQMGLIGYFPSNLVTEMQVYQESTEKMPTTNLDFHCD
ncbi:otoraplin-like [Anguilla anguilla]|uniref:otoraplin-like n=1 Tax=Anguilla anguilla TaxID=7936 RepID=UPI0015AD1EE7|nr:otoraplin-like [Anguilla anguilla]